MDRSRLARYTRLASLPAAAMPAAMATQSANAEIIYSTQTVELYSVGAVATYQFVTEAGAFAFRMDHFFTSFGGSGVMEVFGLVAVNAVVAETALGFLLPARLEEGTVIFAGNVGLPDYQTLWGRLSSPGIPYYYTFGNFQRNTGRGYAGFQFETTLGEARYAWAEVELRSDLFIMHRWAYDDTGAPITAGFVPAPGAVGLFALAAGAAGLRRKRSA